MFVFLKGRVRVHTSMISGSTMNPCRNRPKSKGSIPLSIWKEKGLKTTKLYTFILPYPSPPFTSP